MQHAKATARSKAGVEVNEKIGLVGMFWHLSAVDMARLRTDRRPTAR